MISRKAPEATSADTAAAIGVGNGFRLNAVVVAALEDPEVARRIRLVGMEPVPMTIEAFSAYVDSQIDKAARMQASGDRQPAR